MPKIKLDQVWWHDYVPLGNNYDQKAMKTDTERGIQLWYIGGGVLVEQQSSPDRMVPLANVKSMVAAESLTPDQWAGIGEASIKLVDVPQQKPKK